MQIISIDSDCQQKYLSKNKINKNNRNPIQYKNNNGDNYNKLTFNGKLNQFAPRHNANAGDLGCLTVLGVLLGLITGIALSFAGILGSLYMLCNISKSNLSNDTENKTNCTCGQHKTNTNNKNTQPKATLECKPNDFNKHKVNANNVETNLHCSDVTNKNKQDSVINIQNIQHNVKLSREQQIADLEKQLYTKQQELKLKIKEYEQLKNNGSKRMTVAIAVGVIPAIIIPPATPFTLAAVLFAGVPFATCTGGTYVYNNSKESKFYNTQILPLEKEIKYIKTELSSIHKR